MERDVIHVGRTPSEYTPQLAYELGRFKNHLCGAVLPFWHTHGFQKASGLFCERMTLEGAPVLDVPQRVMVQARQIFVFSHAARCGLYLDGADSAIETLETMLRCFSENGDLTKGLAFSVTGSGHIISTSRDAYAHAFILYALASGLRLTGSAHFRQAVTDIVGFVDGSLTDSRHAGLFDCHPDAPACKSQNPLMHLLEAYLALHEAWPDGGFLGRAGRIVELFCSKLLQSPAGILLETYREDWSVDRDTSKNNFEPGHQYEWAWLLNWYDALSGGNHDAIADGLWTAASFHGRDGRGHCYDEIQLDLNPSKRSFRLWPHTEGAKAAAVRLARGDDQAAAVLVDMLKALNDTFLRRPFLEGWIDRVDEYGNPLVDFVPASSLYHLYSACFELSRCLSEERAADDSDRAQVGGWVGNS